jgi:hypothetical protein
MPILADIATLESRVQELIGSNEQYRSVTGWKRSYVRTLLEQISTLDLSELSLNELRSIVDRVITASDFTLRDGIQQDVSKRLSDILNLNADFYNLQGLSYPDVNDILLRSNDVSELVDRFNDNLFNMDSDLASATIKAIQEQGKTGIDRDALAKAISQSVDTTAFYADTNAKLLTSSYNRISRDVMRESADLQYGFYYGDRRDNSRPFCISNVGRVFDLNQINNMVNGQGLDVKTYCGGYRCIHSWLWVDIEWDAELKALYQKERTLTEVDKGVFVYD